MVEYAQYSALLLDPGTVALAKRMFSNNTAPDHQALFLAMTMIVLPVLPQHAIPVVGNAQGVGEVLHGVCVFYAEQWGDGITPPTYVAYTLQVELGSSASYTFTKVDNPAVVYNASDSEPWQRQLHELLRRSYWLPVHNPATLG